MGILPMILRGSGEALTISATRLPMKWAPATGWVYVASINLVARNQIHSGEITEQWWKYF